jgi:hypothetical protein
MLADTSTPTWQLQRPVRRKSNGLLVRLQVSTAVIRTPQAERRETTRVEVEIERAVPVRTEETGEAFARCRVASSSWRGQRPRLSATRRPPRHLLPAALHDS